MEPDSSAEGDSSEFRLAVASLLALARPSRRTCCTDECGDAAWDVGGFALQAMCLCLMGALLIIYLFVFKIYYGPTEPNGSLPPQCCFVHSKHLIEFFCPRGASPYRVGSPVIARGARLVCATVPSNLPMSPAGEAAPIECSDYNHLGVGELSPVLCPRETLSYAGLANGNDTCIIPAPALLSCV